MRTNKHTVLKWMSAVVVLSLLGMAGVYLQRESLQATERKAAHEAHRIAQAQMKEMAKLTDRVETLQNNLSKTAETVSAQTSTVESLQDRNGALQLEHQKLQEKYDALQQESRRLNQTIAQNEANGQRQIAQKPIYEVKVPEVKFEPKIELPKVRKREVDLIIKSVSVNSTNSNGSVWDSSGPPDLMVSIKNSAGDTFDTDVIQDQHSGTFNVKGLRVAEGDSITVTVWDSDVFASDEIGSFTKTISADTMQQGTVNWQFGGVASLVLEFQP